METVDLLQMVENLKILSHQNQKCLQKRNEKISKTLYECELCKDTGWIEKRRADGSRVYSSWHCREELKVKNQWKAAGINLELSQLTFRNFQENNEFSKRIKSAAIAYYNNFKDIWKDRHNSIMFLGQAGSGKTHISIALAINLLNSKANVVYMPYRDTIVNIKQNILDKDSYMESLLKYKQCQVLLIDDLYKGKVSSSDINIMFEIVNYRYLNHLPMIISSELSFKEILDYDEAVGSRLYEMSKDFIVTMDKEISKNYRLMR